MPDHPPPKPKGGFTKDTAAGALQAGALCMVDMAAPQPWLTTWPIGPEARAQEV